MDVRHSSPLMTLMGVQPVLPARFPTLEELTTPVTSKDSASSNTPGLFRSLVGDPRVVFEDLLRSPEKYEPGVDQLLQELMTGSKSLDTLSTQDQALLDRSVLDLNRSSSKEPASPSKTQKKQSATPVEPPDLGVDLEELIQEGLDPSWFNRY